MIKVWKYSKLRFYLLNTIWNYRFWLYSKKIYKDINYVTEIGDYEMDDFFKLKKNKKPVKKRRFVGYFFENNIYLDNPGMPIKERDVWEKWKKKKLI